MSSTSIAATWEYKIEILDWTENSEDSIGTVEKRLAEWGAEGWELVAVTPKMGKDDSWTFAYFKRPKSN
jgi:hypothetical protein